MSLRGWIGSSALFLSVAASGGSLAAWKQSSVEEANAAAASQPEPVEVVTSALALDRRHRRATTSIGTIHALRSITLRNELPGTVSDMRLETGQIVERGTVLVALDVSVEEAELRAKQAEAKLAETLLGRMQRASESRGASEADVDRARSLAGVRLPDEAPSFTREQVIEHVRRLPRNEAEYAAAEERDAKYQSQLPSSAPIESLFRHMADGPPFTSLAGHPRFIRSAAMTLTAADLPAVREWRRQAIRSLSDETLSDFMAFTAIVNSVIVRFGLYAEYRDPK